MRMQQENFLPAHPEQKAETLANLAKVKMVKEFEDAAFDAEIGKVVGPVKTQFGYHLIKLKRK